MIKNLAKNNGVITFGFNLYHDQNTFLANSYQTKLSTLLNNQPGNINDTQNKTYDYKKNFLNQQQVIYDQSMLIYGYPWQQKENQSESKINSESFLN